MIRTLETSRQNRTGRTRPGSGEEDEVAHQSSTPNEGGSGSCWHASLRGRADVVRGMNRRVAREVQRWNVLG